LRHTLVCQTWMQLQPFTLARALGEGRFHVSPCD
jgi:hypothetical protein